MIAAAATFCVHIDADMAHSHPRAGTWNENQADAVRRGRHANRFTVERFANLPRAERARRSRALRDVVRTYGWDATRISAALADAHEGTATLF